MAAFIIIAILNNIMEKMSFKNFLNVMCLYFTTHRKTRGPPSKVLLISAFHVPTAEYLYLSLFVWLSRNGDTRPNLTSTCPRPPKPIHFQKAYDNSYSKMNKEHKYKDKDEYKDNDKDKDAERITESLTVCYIFGILTTQAF